MTKEQMVEIIEKNILEVEGIHIRFNNVGVSSFSNVDSFSIRGVDCLFLNNGFVFLGLIKLDIFENVFLEEMDILGEIKKYLVFNMKVV